MKASTQATEAVGPSEGPALCYSQEGQHASSSEGTSLNRPRHVRVGSEGRGEGRSRH